MASDPALDKIGRDILDLIIELVHNCSPRTVHAICLCNSVLYEAARPFTIRNCTLDLNSDSLQATQQRITAWLEDARLSWILTAIRSVTLRAEPATPFAMRRDTTKVELEKESTWTPLLALLSKLTSLTDVTYDCPIPIPPFLLAALQEFCPHVHLHIRNWTRATPGTLDDDPSEVALTESPLLRTLHASVRHGMRGWDFQWPAFNRIVARSPTLRSFKYTSRSVGGCCIYSLTQEERENERRLRARFDAEPVQKVIKDVEISKMSPETIIALASVVDWARVETLRGLCIPDNLQILPWDAGMFASLSTIQLAFDRLEEMDLPSEQREHTIDSVRAFLIALPSLQSLSVLDLHDMRPLEGVLRHQGHQIRALHIHEKEFPSYTGPVLRHALTIDEIVAIGASCHHLADFTFDLDGWPTDEDGICLALAQFPALRNLTLNIPLDFTDRHVYDLEDSKEYTSRNCQLARTLWYSLQKLKKGSPLAELVICVGEQDREIGKGRPASWVMEEQQYRRRFVLRPHERDDMLDEVVLHVNPRDL
uniref:A-alpha X3 protein n=1 Tax=Schizophyllum commune TaxID=5334 RepID=Q02466_SCHCO|nr:A-alpha X3 [Schizophyllum commune]